MSDRTDTACDDRFVLDQLMALFESRDVTVRTESLDESPGGLCRINGRHVLILNRHAPPEELLPVCARALGKLVDLEGVYLRPEVRARLEHALQNDYERHPLQAVDTVEAISSAPR